MCFNCLAMLMWYLACTCRVDQLLWLLLIKRVQTTVPKETPLIHVVMHTMHCQ
jgi:hypothetical protein